MQVKFRKPDDDDSGQPGGETPLKLRWNRDLRADEVGPLRGLILFRSRREERSPGDYQVLMTDRVYRRIVAHLKEDLVNEQGGLLYGYETGGPSGRPTVVVTHSVRAKHARGDSSSLTFPEKTWALWEDLDIKLKDLDLDIQRVGWYHSHPNIDIFLSRYDLDVCTNFDRLKAPIALVVDPVRNRGGLFVKTDAGYEPRKPRGFWRIDTGSSAASDPVIDWTNLDSVEFTDASQGWVSAEPIAKTAPDPVTEPGHEPRQTGETSQTKEAAQTVLDPFRKELAATDRKAGSARMWAVAASAATLLALLLIALTLSELKQDLNALRQEVQENDRQLVSIGEELQRILANTGSSPGAQPTIAGFFPTSGDQGEKVAVTLSGTNLDTVTNVNVTGDGVKTGNLKPENSKTLSVELDISRDAPADRRSIVVVTPAGTAEKGDFTINALAPTVTGIVPASGAQGETIKNGKLTGTNLDKVTAVSVSGTNVAATIPQPRTGTPTELPIVIEIGAKAAAGQREVTVQTADGKSAKRAFTVSTAPGNGPPP